MNNTNEENIKKIYENLSKHLINDEKPSEFIEKLSNEEGFKQYPFNLLLKLKETEQSPVHHPEGNAWKHTMLVVDEAAKIKDRSKDKLILMWAALLHDIGKPSTTKLRKGRITSYDHDIEGAKIAKEFLSSLCHDEDFINSVSNLVRFHMHILFVVNNLPFGDIPLMKKTVDINEVALLGLADRLGRSNAKRPQEEENIDKFKRILMQF